MKDEWQGSFERVALPAKGGSSGAPDSRSETLSPREWPTLEAELSHAKEARRSALSRGDYRSYEYWMDVSVSLQLSVDLERSRRPRGESDGTQLRRE